MEWDNTDVEKRYNEIFQTIKTATIDGSDMSLQKYLELAGPYELAYEIAQLREFLAQAREEKNRDKVNKSTDTEQPKRRGRPPKKTGDEE